MDTKTATIMEVETKKLNLHRRSCVKFSKEVSKEAAHGPETHMNPGVILFI